MKLISCLLLAAGQSRRMGEENKLLLPIHGKTLVKKSAEQISRFPFFEKLAVIGFEGEKIEAEIPESMEIVLNHNFEKGLHSSIRAGLLRIHPKSEGFMVCLADQPWVHPQIFSKLMDRFNETEGPRIMYPSSFGKRGNPVLISKHFVPEILNEPDGDYGCAYLFKRHPDKIHEVIVDDFSVLTDIDTPEDYLLHRGENAN